MDSEDSTTLNIKHSSVMIPENTQRLIATNTREFYQPKDGAIKIDSPNPYSDSAVQRRVGVFILPSGTTLIKDPSDKEDA